MTPDEIRGLLATARREIQEEMKTIHATLQTQIETIDARTREWYNQLNRTFKLLLDLDTEDYKARLRRETEETKEREERRKELDTVLSAIRTDQQRTHDVLQRTRRMQLVFLIAILFILTIVVSLLVGSYLL